MEKCFQFFFTQSSKLCGNVFQKDQVLSFLYSSHGSIIAKVLFFNLLLTSNSYAKDNPAQPPPIMTKSKSFI